MKAVRLYGTRDLRLETLPMPTPGPGEVLIQTLYCGVCGSDIPRVFDGDISRLPEAIGHEFSARVVSVGEGVTHVKPGDLVAALPLVVCHQCEDCKNGHYGQCRHSKFIGASYADIGGFIEYNAIDARNVLKLPDSINPLYAAFIEPVSVALHGLKAAKLKPGVDIAIVGAGTIGQLVLQCAKALGAARAFVFDINEKRLALAKKMGAYAAYHTGSEQDMKAFWAETGGRGIMQVVEAVGLEDTIRLSLEIADVEAEVAIIGTMHKDVTLPPKLFYGVFSRRQLHLHGVWMSYSKDFPGVEWRLAAQLIAEGRIDLEPLIDRVVDVEDALHNLEDYQIPGKVGGKIMLRVAAGDYTAKREKLHDGVTIDEIAARIMKRKEQQS